MAQREELLQDSVDKRRSLENCLPVPEAQEAGDRQNFQLLPKISTSAFFSFFGLCCCCFRCDHPRKEGNHTLNVPNWWLKESLEPEGGRKQGDVKLGAAGVTLSVLWGEQCSVHHVCSKAFPPKVHGHQLYSCLSACCELQWQRRFAFVSVTKMQFGRNF